MKFAFYFLKTNCVEQTKFPAENGGKSVLLSC